MIEILEARLKKHVTEQRALELSYQQMMASYKELITAKQTRHAQLTGAIQELQELLKEAKGKKDDNVNLNGDGRNPAVAGDVPGDRSGNSGHSITPLDSRDLHHQGTTAKGSENGDRPGADHPDNPVVSE